jgi:N-acetylmuramoyl-L-alanine amidase
VPPRLYRALGAAGLAAMGPGQQPGPARRLAWRVDAETVWLQVTDTSGDGREAASTVLRIPRGQVDPEWLAAARGTRPTVLVAGIDVGLAPGDTTRDVLARIEEAAERGELLGGSVPLERRETDPDGHAVGTWGLGPGAVPAHDSGAMGSGRMGARGPGGDERGPGRRGPSTRGTDTRGTDTREVAEGRRGRRRSRGAARIGSPAGTSPITAAGRGGGDDERWPSTAARMGLLGVAAVVVAAMVGQTVMGDSSDGVVPPPPRPTGAVAAAVEDAATPSPLPTPPPLPGTPAPWVVAGPDGAPVRSVIDGPVDEVAAAGLLWPILEEVDGSYRVATHCNRKAWVSAADVERPSVGRGDGLRGAVVVLDAGHGGIDAGVPSSTGLLESDLNLAVAERLQALLERSNDVDPETGAVTPGDEHPPVAAVLMTRDAQDAKGGNQRTALVFRGRLATLTDADALLSIHHNAGDVETFSEPPVEVFYSVDDAASPRLAALVVEELRRSFAPLADTWRGATMSGAIGRAGSDGDDYYTVLEEGKVPAAISEALYLSDPAAAALAATEEFQQAQAEGLYRALVRFLDTEETGGDVADAATYPTGDVEPYDYSRCRLAVDEDG